MWRLWGKSVNFYSWTNSVHARKLTLTWKAYKFDSEHLWARKGEHPATSVLHGYRPAFHNNSMPYLRPFMIQRVVVVASTSKTLSTLPSAWSPRGHNVTRSHPCAAGHARGQCKGCVCDAT